jgi:hypothetical protein
MAMRSCDPFEIPLPADLVGTLSRVEALIVSEGGRFTGTATAGQFAGSSPLGTIEGHYEVQGSLIRVTITSKPMLAPCGMIEERIRKYFA